MYKIITEGATRLYVPVEGAFGMRGSGVAKKAPVFYNPHMKLNRDICVLFVKTAGSKVVFADVLTGIGAKGLRVALEGGAKVYLNDGNESAFEIIKKNALLNDVDSFVSNMDANRFVLENRGCFDFIDIDPFGSPVPFIGSSLISLKRKGYLGVTATDTATLCGVYPQTCLRRYQAMPLRSSFCHEVGVRILIGYICRTAAKYDRGISPILSHSTRHYLRTYVSISRGVKAAEESLSQLGYLYYCNRCKAFYTETGVFPIKWRSCGCGEEMQVSGPLWLGGIQEGSRLLSMLQICEPGGAGRLLETLSQEVEAPFYYDLGVLARDFKVSVPKINSFILRLREGGFEASRTHFSPTSVKTNALVEEIKKNLL